MSINEDRGRIPPFPAAISVLSYQSPPPLILMFRGYSGPPTQGPSRLHFFPPGHTCTFNMLMALLPLSSASNTSRLRPFLSRSHYSSILNHSGRHHPPSPTPSSSSLPSCVFAPTSYLLFPSAHRFVLRTSLTPSLLPSLSPPFTSPLRTLANLGLRKAAGPTGLLLLVESDAPAPPAARVGFGVTLPERGCTFCLRDTMEYVCRRGGSKKGRGQEGGLTS